MVVIAVPNPHYPAHADALSKADIVLNSLLDFDWNCSSVGTNPIMPGPSVADRRGEYMEEIADARRSARRWEKRAAQARVLGSYRRWGIFTRATPASWHARAPTMTWWWPVYSSIPRSSARPKISSAIHVIWIGIEPLPTGPVLTYYLCPT